MTLRRQLLIAGILTLLIPWAGFRFVTQLDDALRARQLALLHREAHQLALFLQQQKSISTLPLAGPDQPVIYAEHLDHPLILDGYGDDWPGANGEAGMPLLHSAEDGIFWQAAEDADHLYLFLAVHDANVIYRQPSDPDQPHEQVRIYRGDGAAQQVRIIQTTAPGRVQGVAPQDSSGPEPAEGNMRGYWQATSFGYTLELQMPRLAPDTPFGFDISRPGSGNTRDILGTMGPTNGRLPILTYSRRTLLADFVPYLQPGQSMRLLTDQGWQVSAVSQAKPEQDTDVWSWAPTRIIEQMGLNALRLLLSHHQPSGLALNDQGFRVQGHLLKQALTRDQAVQGITRSAGESAELSAAAPVHTQNGRLVLLLQQSTEDLLSLTSQTLGQVLSRSFLIVMLILLGLLGYASWLSWRITRLRRDASRTIDSEGRVIGHLEPSRRRDELGELSRQFARLVENLRGYNQYLETFARKLSHELKTPLAVLRSSLENLRHAPPGPDQIPYMERAEQGVERISQILQAMSEATRLEKSIEQAERERFDLARVVSEAVAAYQSLDTDHRLTYDGPGQGLAMEGSPELLVQMLDKLIENARDFTPPGKRILIGLAKRGAGYRLVVENDGPPLPEAMIDSIFGAFVSLREGQQEGHLGQGLVIVKLVVQFHKGRVRARNREDGSGVVFEISFPEPAGRDQQA